MDQARLEAAALADEYQALVAELMDDTHSVAALPPSISSSAGARPGAHSGELETMAQSTE